MRRLRLLTSLLAAIAVTIVPLGTTEAATGPIGPGVQMFTNGAQCTANLVFTDKTGRVYVGYAAHCAGLGSASDTNGCTTKSLPLGTRVRFGTGAGLLSGGTTLGYGTLSYSSWIAMQKAKVTNSTACNYNDFALVRVHRAYLHKVNATMPHWGGPVGLAPLPGVGAKVFTVGSSSLRPGQKSPKTGSVIKRVSGHATVRTSSPGIPGDSGSGFLDARGRAVGVLSTIALFPNTASNGVGGLAWEVAFARNHGKPGLRLKPGRSPFVG